MQGGAATGLLTPLKASDIFTDRGTANERVPIWVHSGKLEIPPLPLPTHSTDTGGFRSPESTCPMIRGVSRANTDDVRVTSSYRTV